MRRVSKLSSVLVDEMDVVSLSRPEFNEPRNERFSKEDRFAFVEKDTVPYNFSWNKHRQH